MKENDMRLVDLKDKLNKLYEKIRLKSDLNVEIAEMMLIITLHKHLKITVVFENQFDDAVIYLDGKIASYTHWHPSNEEAIKFVDYLIDDKLVFIETKWLRYLGSQFTYKILELDKYELKKHKLLGERSKNIFTVSEIIQGNLKKIFK
jgi:hypothetical protein